MPPPTIFYPLFTAKSGAKNFDAQGPFRKFCSRAALIGASSKKGCFFGIVFLMLIPLEESIRIPLKSTWRIRGVRWGLSKGAKF